MFIHYLRRILLIVIVLASLLPMSSAQTSVVIAQEVPQLLEVIVEDPLLHPAYTTCKDSHWYEFNNNRGHKAYLTLNSPTYPTNSGEWRPAIPQAGYYRVEAYVAGHGPITWCNDDQWPIAHDTTDARYTIHNAEGMFLQKVSQYPLSNRWLNLGEYYFTKGTTGYVTLTDLNGEPDYTTTVSFSAMRFTYTRASRPQVYLPLMHYNDPSGRPAPDTGVIQGQGFDACNLPTVAQMQTWWNSSPYSFFGLYLGGIHFASFCTKANATWVQAVHAQGWSFIPTWVGPQAPCSSYRYKISSDPTTAYQQGRQEASSASAAAHEMGITNYSTGGTIIYYDMESFGCGSLECRQAVASFMNGWVERLDELGNYAGGYGARSSYITDWAAIPHVPRDVWIASWYATGYDPYASVYGLTWLEGLWTNHQRIRQYAGEVGNTWGGVSLSIDINVADGMVAMPPAGLLGSLSVTASKDIEYTGWVSASQGWLVSGHKLYWTDNRGASWADISPAAIQLAYFLPTGQGWTLSTSDSPDLILYRNDDQGNSWEKTLISLPDGDWQPLQLQFSSLTDGWIVLQKETSQIFSAGVLLKTNDGGLTWQSHDLPVAGRVSFSSPNDLFLQGSRTGVIYHSHDGGLTWLVDKTITSPSAQSNLPNSTQSSGWETENLGWAISGNGSCSGDKSSQGFTCQTNTLLWQTQDGGKVWDSIPIPAVNPPE
jgi:hypothetical protein